MTFFTSRSLLKVCGLGVFVSMPLHAQTTTLSQLAALTQATFSNGRDATWRAADRAITGGYASPEASAAPMFGAEFGSTRVPLGSSRLQTVTTAAAHKVNATTVAGLAIGYSRQSAVDAGALRIVRLSDQSITAFANLRHDAAYVNGKLTIGRVDSANDKRWRSSVAVSGGYDFPIQKAWLVGPIASVQFHQALPTADNSRLFSIGARVASTDLYVKPFARVASVWASGSDTTSQDRRWFQVATGVQAKVADAWVLGASAQTDLARKDARTRSLLLSASRTF